MAGSIADTSKVKNQFRPVGDHEVNSTLSANVEIKPPLGANALIMQAETQSVRWRLDDTPATASDGFLLSTGLILILQIDPNASVNIIETAASATLQYQWGKL